jgi:putative ABC transport system substrate-binding protein
MIGRREFITLLGGAAVAWPMAARAQQPGKMARIGFLGSATAAGSAESVGALRAGLRDFGRVEGRNIVIEFRWAEGKYDRLSDLVAELIRLNVDVIVTHGTPGTRTAKQATTTIPIVMAISGDAIATGIVTSLASEPHGIDLFSSGTQCKTTRIAQGSLSAGCSRGGPVESKQSREQADHSSDAGCGHAVEVGN